MGACWGSGWGQRRMCGIGVTVWGRVTSLVTRAVRVVLSFICVLVFLPPVSPVAGPGARLGLGAPGVCAG